MADLWMQILKKITIHECKSKKSPLKNANIKNRPIHKYKSKINWNTTSYEK